MSEHKGLEALLQEIIRCNWHHEAVKLAHQALEQAREHDVLRARNGYLEAQFQYFGEQEQLLRRQVKESMQTAVFLNIELAELRDGKVRAPSTPSGPAAGLVIHDSKGRVYSEDQIAAIQEHIEEAAPAAAPEEWWGKFAQLPRFSFIKAGPHDAVTAWQNKGGSWVSESAVMELVDQMLEELPSPAPAESAIDPEIIHALNQAKEWLCGWASAEPQLAVINRALEKASTSARVQVEGVEDDLSRLIKFAAAQALDLRDGDNTDRTTEEWCRLPDHLQDLINELSEQMDTEGQSE